jgi:hypothetical protein
MAVDGVSDDVINDGKVDGALLPQSCTYSNDMCACMAVH